MTLLWGKLTQDGTAIILEPEPNPADGIGSALALAPWPRIGPEPNPPDYPLVRYSVHSARVRATLLERIGGEEAWRGPWLFFGVATWPLKEKVYPCCYLRLDERGFVEFGKSMGPKPSDQQIIATVTGQTCEGQVYVCSLSCHEGRVAIDGRAGHIGVFVTEQASPFLGLYCEGSRVRWEVE